MIASHSSKDAPLPRWFVPRRTPAPQPPSVSTAFSEGQSHANTQRLMAELRRPRAKPLLSLAAAPFSGTFYRIEVNRRAVLPKFILLSWGQEPERFLGLSRPGSDILRFSWAGLQYHWRSDLAKAYEEGCPFIGRLQISSERGTINVDHVVIPVFTQGTLTDLCGWFIFDTDTGAPVAAPELWSDRTVVRRLQRSKAIALPPRLGNNVGPAAWLSRLKRFALSFSRAMRRIFVG